jgi:hypothetical protein
MRHLSPGMIQDGLNLDLASEIREPRVFGQIRAVLLQPDDVIVGNE